MSLETKASLEACQNSTEFFLPFPVNGKINWIGVELSKKHPEDNSVAVASSAVQYSVTEVRDTAGDLITDYFRVGKEPLNAAPKTSRNSFVSRCLQTAAIILITAASATPLADFLDKKNVQAREPGLFPDPSPLKPLEVKGGMPSQNIKITSNYETQFFKAAGSELVGVVNLPGETTQRIIKKKVNPITGEEYLEQIGTPPFRIADVGISQDNPKAVLAVGLDMTTDKGKAILTENEGGSWLFFDPNQIPLLARGPLLKVEVVDPTQAFISQGDRLAEDYPNFYLNFNLNSKTFTDLLVCAQCTVGGLPGNFLPLSSDTVSGITSADPRLGYKRKIFNSSAIISSEELRGTAVGYVQGDPKQYTDRQGLNDVLVFNNFARNPANPNESSGIVYRDRYQRLGSNFTFYDSTVYQPLDSLYPSYSGKGLAVASLEPDVMTDDIYAGIGMNFLVPPDRVGSMASYVEVMNSHILLPTNGAWINLENERWIGIKGLGLSVKGGNKLLQTALAKYRWVDDPATQTRNLVFEQGQLMTFDVTGGINPQRQWQGLNLYIYDSTYKLYLPVITN